MLKHTYSQIGILEREATTQNKQTVFIPEIDSVAAREPQQEASNVEPSTSDEARTERLSGGCMMFDCLLSMDSFGFVSGGCKKNETDQLLDAVPSAGLEVKSCTGIDSIF